MLHRHLSVTAAAALAAGTLALAGAPGSASAHPAHPAPPLAGKKSPAPEVSTGMLEAMQRDLGLTAAQAQHRITGEQEATALAQVMRTTLGDRFGGVWLTGKQATLHVATTRAADADMIKAKGAQPKVVKHSLKALRSAKKSLDETARQSAPDATPVWYVDVRTNKVVLLSAKPDTARAFAAQAGVDEDLVTVRKSSVKPRTFQDLRGGDAYYINERARCSIGFSVQKGDQDGFVSAGHCGDPGDTTTGYDKSSQGTFKGSHFPGHDYSWVATNDNWTATPTVNGYGTSDVRVTGDQEAIEGASVCRSGSTSGWHCGTVQQRDTSVHYSEGTVYGVTRTNVCAEPGDSGGPFVSGTEAQGTTSGGSGDCDSGGTTYFQPVKPALGAFGLTLVTTGNN
jgi:streptogrisin C